MFIDIELFNGEKQKYLEGLQALEMDNTIDKNSKINELKTKFKDDIRKYLPTCLNIINTNYNCHFSLYKIGKDYDSAFNVIETNVKKSRDEVASELTNYQSLLNTNALTAQEKHQLDLATEIVLTYVEDVNDKPLDAHLMGSKPVASSIIDTTPRMANPDNVFKQEQNIQYNPYANQPINFNEQPSSNQENNGLNIFNNIGQVNNIDESNKVSMDSSLNSNNGQVNPLDTNSGMNIFFNQNIDSNNNNPSS